MMRGEKYVNLEQAKALKAAGFDWMCETQYIEKIEESKHEEWNEELCAMSTVWDIIRTPKPTLTQAAKWLREEAGVDLVISPKFNSRTGDRIGYFWRWPQRTDVIDTKTYRTYEGALLAGVSTVLEPFIEYDKEVKGTTHEKQ